MTKDRGETRTVMAMILNEISVERLRFSATSAGTGDRGIRPGADRGAERAAALRLAGSGQGAA